MTPTAVTEYLPCKPQNYQSTPLPTDPWSGWLTIAAAASSFSEKVQRAALIAIVTDWASLPAIWNTADGKRPADPHHSNFRIVTPSRVTVKQLVYGNYALPEIYCASEGGRIGQDCYVVSSSSVGSGSGELSDVYLAFMSPYEGLATLPVPGDTRYRYYSIYATYPIGPSGTITIGPERDIMGYKKDDPPRRITIEEALREIAALTGMPTPAPTR